MELRVNVGEGLAAIEFLAYFVGQGLQLQHPFPQVWVVVIEVAQFFSFGVRAEPAAPAGWKCLDRRKQPCPLAELLCIFLCAVVLVQ